MPAGRVKRIDKQRNVVYIVRRGHTLAAPLSEVEPKARVPNARVEFRLVRDHGDVSAADVRLRRGTRTNRRQRRFGDLTGARLPGAKVATTATHRLGIDASSPPFQVVEAWLDAMSDWDVDGAAALYRPDAVLHAPDGDVTGRNRLRAALEQSPLAGLDPDAAEVYGLGRYVRVDCPVDGVDHGASFVVERGEIIEQWVDLEPDREGEAETEKAPPFQLAIRGAVRADARRYARTRVDHLIDTVGRPVRFVRVKLTAVDNPANERSAMAEIVLDLDRTIVRAHADARTFTEAVDRAVDRIQVRIRHERSRRKARQRGREATDESPISLSLTATTGPEPGAATPERPEIVRHRSFAPDSLTIDEAAWDLGMLDYNFLLFVEAETGDDAVLSTADDDSLVIQFRHPVDNGRADCMTDVLTAEGPPPSLRPSEAIELLANTGSRFVFFVDPASGRGNIVYRRHDGHYGLIIPADEKRE
ncbi:MAG: sigma 54 modulation/S30EA ribosomal C-terminal domain-containing protein [Acidimicrobiia bacterium]|nr:sigma 54 modulation/S30EA ribosomal C-terminal domain-containing protein [Acidimicrobiia bacterium]